MYEYKICKELNFENDLHNLDYFLSVIFDSVNQKVFTYFLGKGYWNKTFHKLLRIEFSKKTDFKKFDELLIKINMKFTGAPASYHINFGNQSIAGRSEDCESKLSVSAKTSNQG